MPPDPSSARAFDGAYSGKNARYAPGLIDLVEH